MPEFTSWLKISLKGYFEMCFNALSNYTTDFTRRSRYKSSNFCNQFEFIENKQINVISMHRNTPNILLCFFFTNTGTCSGIAINKFHVGILI